MSFPGLCLPVGARGTGSASEGLGKAGGIGRESQGLMADLCWARRMPRPSTIILSKTRKCSVYGVSSMGTQRNKTRFAIPSITFH